MPLKQTTGSRAQVMHGTAKKTSGGLTKSQLKYNKQGKIVSKKASALAKKNNRLVKAGYITRKGVFGSGGGKMRGGGGEWSIVKLPKLVKFVGNTYRKFTYTDGIKSVVTFKETRYNILLRLSFHILNMNSLLLVKPKIQSVITDLMIIIDNYNNHYNNNSNNTKPLSIDSDIKKLLNTIVEIDKKLPDCKMSPEDIKTMQTKYKYPILYLDGKVGAYKSLEKTLTKHLSNTARHQDQTHILTNYLNKNL